MSDEPSTSPNFESVRQINPYGMEYWSARDLMPLLGYKGWREFDGAIKRAITAFEQGSKNKPTDHFVFSYKMIPIGKGGERRVRDYNLSRLACYLIAENGNPRIPEIAAAQTYFAVATRENELRQLAEAQNERIAERTRLAENTKALSDAAERAGVTSKTFGIFHDAGYKGLYGGLGIASIKARKGVDAKEDLADRMGRAELAANNFRATLAEERITNEGITGANSAIQAHHDVAEGVRETIKRYGGTMPEDLPAERSVRPLIQQSKRGQTKASQPKEQAKLFDELTEQKDENDE